MVDRQGGWLAGWRAGHAALGTRLLRSPVNQSPSTNPTALREFAKAARMEASMETALPGFLPLPTPSLQDAFCQKKLVAALPPSAKGLRHHHPLTAPPPCVQLRMPICTNDPGWTEGGDGRWTATGT